MKGFFGQSSCVTWRHESHIGALFVSETNPVGDEFFQQTLPFLSIKFACAGHVSKHGQLETMSESIKFCFLRSVPVIILPQDGGAC